MTGGWAPLSRRATEVARASCRALEGSKTPTQESGSRVVDTLRSIPIGVLQDFVRRATSSRDIEVQVDTKDLRAHVEELKRAERIKVLKNRIRHSEKRLDLILASARDPDIDQVKANFRAKNPKVRRLYESLLDRYVADTRELRELEDPGCLERERQAKKKRAEERRLKRKQEELELLGEVHRYFENQRRQELEAKKNRLGDGPKIRDSEPSDLPPVPKKPRVSVEDLVEDQTPEKEEEARSPLPSYPGTPLSPSLFDQEYEEA